MDALGLSYRQLRERLAALAATDGLLDGQVRHGERGRSEYSVAVLEMLREMDQLAGNLGLSLAEAAAEVASSVKGKIEHVDEAELADLDGKRVKQDGKVNGNRDPVALEALVEKQAEEIAWLRRQVERLQDTIDELMPLALPAPKRRWWSRMLGK